MQLSVWVPNDLASVVKEKFPEVNVSKLLQDSLRGLLKCEHDEVVCSGCGAGVDKRAMVDEALSAFYRQVQYELFDLIHAGGTCEGAAQVVKSVAEAHQISASRRVQLTRPPRGVRARREWDRRWLEEQQRLELE